MLLNRPRIAPITRINGIFRYFSPSSSASWCDDFRQFATSLTFIAILTPNGLSPTWIQSQFYSYCHSDFIYFTGEDHHQRILYTLHEVGRNGPAEHVIKKCYGSINTTKIQMKSMKMVVLMGERCFIHHAFNLCKWHDTERNGPAAPNGLQDHEEPRFNQGSEIGINLFFEIEFPQYKILSHCDWAESMKSRHFCGFCCTWIQKK